MLTLKANNTIPLSDKTFKNQHWNDLSRNTTFPQGHNVPTWYSTLPENTTFSWEHNVPPGTQRSSGNTTFLWEHNVPPGTQRSCLSTTCSQEHGVLLLTKNDTPSKHLAHRPLFIEDYLASHKPHRRTPSTAPKRVRARCPKNKLQYSKR